jgi:predicted HAD superfamily Cof-like phosphohydrolase
MEKMMTNFEMTKEFMRAFGQEVRTEASIPDNKTIDLRLDLMYEEFNEVSAAIDENNIHNIAKELTDLLVVTYGAGAAFGIDLDKCFAEVHSSNMSKLGEDGKPIYREDGKVLKGPNYVEADMSKVVK